MQKPKGKTMAILIATILVISMGASITIANAHTPAWQIPTYSFCVVSPNPVGLGQTVNVNLWVNLPPPTANQQFGDRWTGMTVEITKPDGTTETLGPFTSDDTGGTFTTFTPNVIGNYTFQMKFAGQTISGSNLAPGQTSPFIGDYFQPSSSNIVKLTVQQEQITYPGVNPLPTNYWTRPIYAENNNWNTVSGNWLGLGVSTFANTGMYNASANYNPYTTAPNAPHILWTRPVAWGGIIGGEFGNSETANYYSTSQYEPKFAPIIMQGVLYYTQYPGSSSYPAGWSAVDLHTGQTIWTKDTTEILLCGQLLDMVTPNQYGVLSYLWSNPVGNLTAGSSRPGVQGSLEMWDAMTGNYILTITGSVPMTLTEDERGNLIGYFVNNTDHTLNMWNSTRCINLSVPSSNNNGIPLADNWYWRPPTGAQLPFAKGIQWKMPIVTNYTGNALPANLAIAGVNSNVVFMAAYPNVGASQYQAGYIIEAGYSAIDGQQLWITNRTQVIATRVLYGSTTMGSGILVELDSSALTASGFSLNTGNKVWGPVALPNISPYSSLGMQYCVANGIIYVWTYGGDIYAINILTGTVNWEYHSRPADLESPYGIWPLWTFTVGTVADGKLFVPEGHMYSPPLFHEAQQLAINITNGELVWSIDAFDVTSAPAIADGVMTTLNAYDNQIYAYGKGPTAMSVTAPKTSFELGKSVIIEGYVMDISAGTQQQAQAANFPNGLPCVSDESQSAWMKYVYMQQPCPTDVLGVPVTISVLDANGNSRNIGIATTDASGMFSFQWTPDIPGKYVVTAKFDGSESYYSSYAETSFITDPATATPTPAQPATQSTADMYFIPAVIAIIVTIVISFAATIVVLRKRP